MAPDRIAASTTVPAEAVPLAGRVMVVAVHGNGGSAHRFARVEPLMPPDVELVAVTLPGFADLPADPRLRSLTAYAACLARTIEPLALLSSGSATLSRALLSGVPYVRGVQPDV